MGAAGSLSKPAVEWLRSRSPAAAASWWAAPPGLLACHGSSQSSVLCCWRGSGRCPPLSTPRSCWPRFPSRSQNRTSRRRGRVPTATCTGGEACVRGPSTQWGCSQWRSWWSRFLLQPEKHISKVGLLSLIQRSQKVTKPLPIIRIMSFTVAASVFSHIQMILFIHNRLW